MRGCIHEKTVVFGAMRHPAFEQYVENQDYRVVGGSLPVTDSIMRDSFWLGLYPGMTPEKLQYMIQMIIDFVHSTK